MSDRENQIEKADILKKDKKFKAAIELLEKLYKKDPKNNKVKEFLTNTLLDYAGELNDEFIREYNEALKILQKVIKIHPENYRALYNIGITYHNLGEYQNALDALNAALEINPDYKYCYYNIGLIYEDLHDFIKALKAYTKAVKIDKNFSYATQAKRDIQQLIDSSSELEIPILDKIDHKSLEKLKNLLKMSNTVKIEMLEEILKIEKPKVIDLIIGWGDKYQFKLDGDYLIINKETLPNLLKELE